MVVGKRDLQLNVVPDWQGELHGILNIPNILFLIKDVSRKISTQNPLNVMA
jgi:hypothetical protein